MLYEVAALATALSWVLASLFATDASKRMGGMTFNRLRVSATLVMLTLITLMTGELVKVPLSDYLILGLSGVIGIAVGDSALFATMKRMGPRRAQVLYATNAPMIVLLGVLFLHEQLSGQDLLGITLVFCGVIITIIWGKRASQQHHWEEIQGAAAIAIALGLLAAFGQAIGTLLVKPILDRGVDPMAVSTIRIAAAALAMWSAYLLRKAWLAREMRNNFQSNHAPPSKATYQITAKDWLIAAMNALLAMVIGVSLLLYAFSIGDVGIASILASTTTVMMLPLLWLKTREAPAAGAWVGALLALIGTAILFTS